jgi:hypothetical protein
MIELYNMFYSSLPSFPFEEVKEVETPGLKPQLGEFGVQGSTSPLCCFTDH